MALAQSNPTGGVAVHGSANFSAPTPNRLTVTTQNGAGTNHSAINWQSFSIPSGSSTNFVQPGATSTVINRVVTNTPSAIFGTLSSNGRVVLVNQSGIAVGAGAVVDTAGFTASALRMSDADALSGRLRFGGADASSSAITVDGRIVARNGDLVLIAPDIGVGASAVLQAPNGATILAAGQQVEITGRGLEGISLLVQAPSDQARNLGALSGDAVGVFAGTLRHSGSIQATTATLEGGRVVLKASGDAYVSGAGSIVATGSKGGQVDVLGHRVSVTDQALVDVSGGQGGGTIRIGGDYQGKNPDVPNASRTYLGQDAVLKADALDNGDGGKVIVWADELTKAHGSISARGGAAGGDGGFVEVSGKRKLVFDAQVDTRAPHGKIGRLLLDPDNIDVVSGGGSTLADADDFADPGSNPSTTQIDPSLIDNALTDVILQANEDINFIDPVTILAPGIGLEARAGGFVNIQSTASITTHGGVVRLTAGDAGSLTGPSEGALFVNGAIDTTAGGAVPNGAIVLLRSDLSDVGGNTIFLNADINAGITGSVTLNANSIRIDQNSGVIRANNFFATANQDINLNQANVITGDVQLSTPSGAIVFNNTAAAQFTNVTAFDDVSLTTTANTASVGLLQSLNGVITVVAPGGIVLGGTVQANGAGGQLLLDSSGGNGFITQPGGSILVSGATSVNAGTGDISLDRAANNFSSIALTGGHITVVDADTLTVSSRSQAGNRNLFLQAGSNLTLPAAGINLGAGQLSLISGGNFDTPGNLSGSAVLLSAAGNLSLSDSVTATTTLLLSGGTGIVQSAGAITATGGVTTISGGSGPTTLMQGGNDFAIVGGTGSAIQLHDSNNIALAGITASSLVVDSGGAITHDSGTISTAVFGGNIQLQGASIGASGFGNFMAVQPGSGAVILNSGSGGIYVQQAAGDLNLSQYSIQSAGVGQDIQLAGASGAGSDVNINNFIGMLLSTNDDRLKIVALAPGGDVNITAGVAKTALSIAIGAEGSGGNVNLLPGPNALLTADQGVNVFSYSGNVNVAGGLSNNVAAGLGGITIQAGGAVTGGGNLQTWGAGIIVNANETGGSFVQVGPGTISLGALSAKGLDGFNSAIASDAMGKSSDGIDLFTVAGSITVASMDSRGGTGATHTPSGLGQVGGTGGYIEVDSGAAVLSLGGAINSSGGKGGDSTQAGAAGGAGGDAGAVMLRNYTGDLQKSGSVTARGGDGGNALAGPTAAAGGAPGNPGSITLSTQGNLQFTGATSFDNTPGFPGADNTGAGGSSAAAAAIHFDASSGGNITQSAGAAISAPGMIVSMQSNANITLTESGNAFGEIDGSAQGNVNIVGLSGVGDSGFSSTVGTMSLSLPGGSVMLIQGPLTAPGTISLSAFGVGVYVDPVTSSAGDVVITNLGGGTGIKFGSVITGQNIQLNGNALLDGGILVPGGDGGIGNLVATGDLVMMGSSVLKLDVSSAASHDMVSVGNYFATNTPNETLHVTDISGGTLGGTTVTLLSAAQFLGPPPVLSGPVGYSLVVGANTLAIGVPAPPAPPSPPPSGGSGEQTPQPFVEDFPDVFRQVVQSDDREPSEDELVVEGEVCRP